MYKTTRESGIAAKASADKYSKEVKQLDLNGNILNTFRNKHDASKATGIMPNNIKMCCDGKRKTAGKFKWTY